MTPQSAAIELLERLATLRGDPLLISAHEMAEWPVDAIAALKVQKLISKAPAGSSAVCPGCEEQCVMSVHTIPAPAGKSSGFVVCDKRDDINRVAVSIDRLLRWRCSVEAVCGFVADCLNLRQSSARADAVDLRQIGIVTGKKRSQMLCLRVGSRLDLVAGRTALPLDDLISFDNGVYRLNSIAITQIVDASDITDTRYTPSATRREARKLETQARYKKWQRAYRSLTKTRPDMSDTWYAKQIAKSAEGDGKDSGTIRKHIRTTK